MQRHEARRVRRVNKEDTQTVDHVLDNSTRLKLLNLINAGTLNEIGGVIATGKESNGTHLFSFSFLVVESYNFIFQKQILVYHALGRNIKQYGDAAPEIELAVKIFSIGVTVFRHRQKYMHSERRFRGNLAKAATKKFIRVWAEKEMRNLCRVLRSGIRW